MASWWRQRRNTLTSMSNLAEVLNRQGKCEEAEEMHRQAVSLKETVLGKEYPSTLTGMNQPAHHVKRSLETYDGSHLTALGYL